MKMCWFRDKRGGHGGKWTADEDSQILSHYGRTQNPFGLVIDGRTPGAIGRRMRVICGGFSGGPGIRHSGLRAEITAINNAIEFGATKADIASHYGVQERQVRHILNDENNRG